MKTLLRYPRIIRGFLSTVPWYLSLSLFWFSLRVHLLESIISLDKLLVIMIPIIAFYAGYKGIANTAWTRRRLVWNLLFAVIGAGTGMYIWPMESIILKGICLCLLIVWVRAFDDAYWYFSSDN